MTTGCRQFPAMSEQQESRAGTAVGYRGKRAFDIAVSLAALILLSPLMAILWVLVRATVGSPAVFRQRRPGLHEAPFEILKFRTMTDEKTEDGSLRPDGERLTRLGAILRKTSLDELPELWNVLRGDMSLVGPRPLLVEYLPYYTPRERRRHEVRPGITGFAQVTGRNMIEWADRLECDVRYVEDISLGFDLKILAKTVASVLRREGIAVDTDEVETRLDEERREQTAEARGRASETGSLGD